MHNYPFIEDNIIEYDTRSRLSLDLDLMYVLCQESEDPDSSGGFNYAIYVIDKADDSCEELANFNDSTNAFELPYKEYKNSRLVQDFYKTVSEDFQDKVAQAESEVAPEDDEDNYDWDEDGYGYGNSLQNDDWAKAPKSSSRTVSRWGSSSYKPASYVPATYKPWTPKKTKLANIDDYCKSDTLVFHKTDSTTTMLSQVYDGKGQDVITQTDVDKDQLKELFERHERIVCLGHGSPYGLMGGNIGPEEAPLFKGKKIFAIWCNADAYFKKYGIGDGFFITKNAPSEVQECAAAGCGNISAALMLENITYWCKLCGEIAEDALEGRGAQGVEYVRKNYLEQYGNHPVSLYNADSASLLNVNTPLPKYEFKGKPLEPKDYPYPGYNEEEFLKNPIASIPARSYKASPSTTASASNASPASNYPLALGNTSDPDTEKTYWWE